MTQYEKDTLQCLINIDAGRRTLSIHRGDTQNIGVNPSLLKMNKKDRDLLMYGVRK